MSAVEADPGRTGSRTQPTGLLAGPGNVTGGKSTAWWGMVLLIFTEATFFAILLTTYWYIRFSHGPVWPPDGIEKPSLFLISIMTPILLLSSAPMHWAETGIKKGRTGRLKVGLFVTFAMGATFLIMQGFEYHDLVKEFTPRTDVYGTLFFTITGFHGLHVLIGLLMNMWIQYYAWRGRFTAERYTHVEVVAMYWHFVDAVWVFILASLYPAPHF